MQKTVLRILKIRFFHKLIGWGFAYMSFLLPVERLRETRTLVAFRHPSPSYPVHILLVPKKAISSLAGLSERDSGFLSDLFRTVNELVRELGLEKCGYRLVANGGAYQEIGQLHFHLISEG